MTLAIVVTAVVSFGPVFVYVRLSVPRCSSRSESLFMTFLRMASVWESYRIKPCCSGVIIACLTYNANHINYLI